MHVAADAAGKHLQKHENRSHPDHP